MTKKKIFLAALLPLAAGAGVIAFAPSALCERDCSYVMSRWNPSEKRPDSVCYKRDANCTGQCQWACCKR